MKLKIKLVIMGGVLAVIVIFVVFFLPRIIGDSVYPLRYRDDIKKYSLAYNLNPNLVAGMIQVESGFNTYATSPVGARGLMQIMPATGAGLAGQLGDRRFSYDRLFRPETSIRYGTYYIKQLVDKYRGSVELALTAYNGGPGAADYYATYGRKTGLSGETSSYPGKILRSKSVYDKVYGEWWKAEAKAKSKTGVQPLAFLKNLFRPEPSIVDLVLTWLLPR